MGDFKDISLRPMTGAFDTLSSADEIGFGNWRVVKNAVTRSTRNRQRGGGWRRLFADDTPYNNQDLHDQLTDRLAYYESFTDRAFGGGNLSGYGYPYFSGSYSIDGAVVFPPASGPYAPVYIGDFPGGIYNGCPIFYPTVGYPYNLIPGIVDATGARCHWKMDEAAATTPDLFGGVDLNWGGPDIAEGLIGNSLEFVFGSGDDLQATNAAFALGDITFGFTFFVRFDQILASTQYLLQNWSGAGNRVYRLTLNSSQQLVLIVSVDGTTTAATLTHSLPIPINDWTMIAVWHDKVANTLNIKVNDGATESVAHSTGVFAGGTDLYVGRNQETIATLSARIDSLTFWKNRFPSENELAAIYSAGFGVDYPFSSNGLNTGPPFHYLYSSLYASCPMVYDDTPIAGYPYGPRFPLYNPLFDYEYEYCGTTLWHRAGCREAVTHLQEIVTTGARKLIAGTMSRLYELNQSSGNWRVLADGMGSPGYTAAQCGCNDVRSMTATMGSYLIHTNNFDPPGIYLLGEESATCDLNSIQPITDLIALGITRAGGVVTWKGFTFFYDITEDGERKGGEIIWSDFEAPDSYIESDTSFAGRATVAVGATILNAAPLGNWLILYTDKGIIRVTLVGGDDVFNFEDIYRGGNALKYKFSLINTGDAHLYLGESDIYVFTQFDTRPINQLWITKAAGMIFNGISEDDASYSPINVDACNLVTGGWNEETKEAFLSWPTGAGICPNVTLRLNTKFNTADFIDHGFTAFLTFRKDERPTVGEWIEDMGLCPRGSKIATGVKDGEVCDVGSVVENPPLYIRNETEDPDLPAHEDSLCARLEGMSLDDFCEDCAPATTFIAASASDFTLKQLEDDIFYRQILGGDIEAYDGYSCHGEFYTNVGYDTAMQEGAERYRSEDEKIIKRIRIEAEPLAQASPSTLECDIGYAPTPSCFTWKEAEPKLFECQSNKSAAQHIADGTRPDEQFNFPVWRRGVYLSARFRITGIGGGGTFSAIHKAISGWGQASSP